MTAYITANNNSGKALVDKDVKDKLNEYKAYNSVAKKIFGDFALINNIEECD